jgi:hypothetical protein
MTMVAIQVGPDHAEVVADSMSYTYDGQRIAATRKLALLERQRAVMVSQGDHGFHIDWYLHVAEHVEDQAADFDQAVDAYDGQIGGVWDAYVERCEALGEQRAEPSTAFLVGWSPAAGRFRAYAWSSSLNMERIELTDPYVMPAPIPTYRPGPIEIADRDALLAAHVADGLDPANATETARHFGLWDQAPPLPWIPNVETWTQLSKLVRLNRAVACRGTGLQVYVGGDVVHAHLTRGDAVFRRIHRFDDTGDEFRAMMAGTPWAETSALQVGVDDLGDRDLLDYVRVPVGPGFRP